MKSLITILFLSTFIGCQDKVTETQIKEVSTPAICPPGNPELEPSPHTFSGLTTISNISQTSMDLSWEENTMFHSFHIIHESSIERKILKTVVGKKSSTSLTGLSPNSEYTLLVRAMDKNGLLEANTQKITVRTKDWPNFSNQRSVSFNGAQSVELGASDTMLSSAVFTIAFWMKMDIQNNKNAHLITFHRDNTRAASALALILKNDTIQLKLKNKNHKPNLVLTNGQWKFVTLASNGKTHQLYLNGEKVLTVEKETPKFGSFKVSVASFTGIRKGYIGKLDELAIFRTYMNQAQVQELYNNGSPMNYPMHSKGSTLKYWYQFGDHSEDGPAKITEHISGLHGAPLNLDNSSFSNDSP